MPESHASAPVGSPASALLAALPGSSVTVCSTELALRQVTVVPFGTVSEAGSNFSESVMLTLAVPAPLTADGDAATLGRGPGVELGTAGGAVGTRARDANAGPRGPGATSTTT